MPIDRIEPIESTTGAGLETIFEYLYLHICVFWPSKLKKIGKVWIGKSSCMGWKVSFFCHFASSILPFARPGFFPCVLFDLAAYSTRPDHFRTLHSILFLSLNFFSVLLYKYIYSESNSSVAAIDKIIWPIPVVEGLGIISFAATRTTSTTSQTEANFWRHRLSCRLTREAPALYSP